MRGDIAPCLSEIIRGLLEVPRQPRENLEEEVSGPKTGNVFDVDLTSQLGPLPGGYTRVYYKGGNLITSNNALRSSHSTSWNIYASAKLYAPSQRSRTDLSNRRKHLPDQNSNKALPKTLPYTPSLKPPGLHPRHRLPSRSSVDRYIVG